MKFAFRSLLCLGLVIPGFGQQKPAQEKPPQEKKEAPAAAAKEIKPTDIVMWVGNEGVTRERFEALLRGVPPQFKAAAQQMSKREFANQYGMLLGLSRVAEKEKLDQDPSFKDQLEFNRMQLLAQLAFGVLSTRGQTISDAQVGKYYKEHQGEFEQVKVRGIFIGLAPPLKPGEKEAERKNRSDAEAKTMAEALRKKILEGADFAAVAKESSEEPGTAAKGGDFGSIRRGQLPPKIEQAIFALEPKKVSEPVPDARGYYLFLVEEKKTSTPEEATPQIRAKLQQEGVTGALDKVKSEYAVKFNEDYFGEPAPAPKPAPTPAPPPKQ